MKKRAIKMFQQEDSLKGEKGMLGVIIQMDTGKLRRNVVQNSVT